MIKNTFFEKTLEDIIINNQEDCVKRGFPIFFEKTLTQVPLPSGGIIDMLSYEFDGDNLKCKIFEFKREIITISSLIQVFNYAAEVFELTVEINNTELEIFLIGTEVSSELLTLSYMGLTPNLVSYNYHTDGIKFNYIQPNGKICDIAKNIKFNNGEKSLKFYRTLSLMEKKKYIQ